MNKKLIYHSLKIKAGEIGYSTVGTGTPLILIVGYSGTLFHWNRTFIEQLAQNYQVYMLDNRNVGKTSTTNPNSVAGMALDIIDFIVELKIVQPLIMGWSMGGIITQEIERLRPDLAKGLILVATVAQTGQTNPEFSELLINAENMTEDQFKTELYGFFFSEEKPKLSIKNYINEQALALQDYHYKFNQAAKHFQQYAIATWAGYHDHDYQLINKKVLIVKARDDRIIDNTISTAMFQQLKQGKLIFYPSGGHFLIHAKAQELAQDIYNTFKD